MSGSTRKSVCGTPISLFRFASLATVFLDGLQIEERMSLVDVLPAEPVIPTNRAELRLRTAAPSAPSAANKSSGTIVAAAPRASASST